MKRIFAKKDMTIQDRIIKVERIKWKEILPLQPDNLKIVSNKEDIKNSIEKHGFSMPFFIWENKGKYYAIDGHTRLAIMKEMDNIPEELPAVFINANNRKDAIKILLDVYNQKANAISSQELYEFLKVESIPTDAIEIDSILVMNTGNPFFNLTDEDYASNEEEEEEAERQVLRITDDEAISDSFLITVADKDFMMKLIKAEVQKHNGQISQGTALINLLKR